MCQAALVDCEGHTERIWLIPSVQVNKKPHPLDELTSSTCMGIYSCQMPTEVLQSKIVISDGYTWVSVKTAPILFYGGDMTYNFKPKRQRCPYCDKLVALDRKGRLQTHNFRLTGKRCVSPRKIHNEPRRDAY
jgi:hypothetical protein